MEEFIDLLSKVIFFTIVATIVLAIVTYAAYKIRTARKGPTVTGPPPIVGEDGSFLEPVLFEKYTPEVKEKEQE
jgi:hypothetical protein